MAIKQYNKQFVYVKVEKAHGKTETLVMSMHAPYFMARISKFTQTFTAVASGCIPTISICISFKTTAWMVTIGPGTTTAPVEPELFVCGFL